MPQSAPEDCEVHGGFRPPTDHAAAADIEAKGSAIVLSFDPSTQELGPLLEAAYCLMSQASCHIDSSRNRYLCRLVPNSIDPTGDALRASFLDLVTEANLRARAPATIGTVSRG
jgi:hypothetical protein